MKQLYLVLWEDQIYSYNISQKRPIVARNIESLCIVSFACIQLKI